MTTETTMQRKTDSEVTQTEPTRSGRQYRPNVDIIEQPGHLLIRADMAGVRGDQIDVRFENGTLTIFGPAAQRQQQNTEYLLCEYGVGDFYRTFRVSEAIDAQQITAAYQHGVLTLHLPKAAEAKPRQVTVQVG